MAEMYLMSGPSGAGKTTFAKEFAKKRNLQYLSIDDFYTLINGDERRHEDETEVWLIFFKAIHLAEQHGRNVIIDTNSPTATKRSEFVDWFPNFEHHLIFIDAPFELCKQNNASRWRQIPDDELREIYETVERPMPDEVEGKWSSVSYYRNENNGHFLKEGTLYEFIKAHK